MLKTKNVFLDHFARLGVFSKVQSLMDDGSESEGSVIKSPTDSDLAAQSTSAQSPTVTSPDDSAARCKHNFFLIIFQTNLIKFKNSYFFFPNFQLKLHQMMQKKFFKAKHISGTNGVYAVAVIACTFGLSQLHWNYQMAQMDGSVL